MDALAKDLAGLKKKLHVVSLELTNGNNDLETLNRSRELARADLKNIQTLKDPLIQNYDLRISQKEKELVLLEADIEAAQGTKQDIDEAMADRLETGRHAIDNAIKVERDIQESIKFLKQKEAAILQDISNTKDSLSRESSALTLLRESVVSLQQEQDRVQHWLQDKEVLIKTQESLETKEQELNAGRDYLTEREKELASWEHDLHILEARLAPEYIELFSHTNSIHINDTTHRK